MKIAIGNDHAAFEMKNEIKAYLEGKGYEVLNLGCDSRDRVDYPDYAEKIGKAVVSGEADLGIAICHFMCVTDGEFTIDDPGIETDEYTEYIATVRSS